MVTRACQTIEMTNTKRRLFRRQLSYNHLKSVPAMIGQLTNLTLLYGIVLRALQ